MIGRTNMGAGKEEQEKTITITVDGTYTVTPDANKTLSKVIATVNDASNSIDTSPAQTFIRTTGNGYAHYTVSASVDVTIGKIYVFMLSCDATRYINDPSVSVSGGTILKNTQITNGYVSNSVEVLATSSTISVVYSAYNNSNLPNYSVVIIKL